MIEFQTLGSVELRGPTGEPFSSIATQPKRLALLAYLCLAAPRGFHRRDTLLALFWPESNQAHGRTSLRNAIHVLRGALGADTLISRGDEQISVNFQRLRCDAVAFEEVASGERPQEAVSIYRGDFLAGFFVRNVPEWERWLESERSRLRSLAAHTSTIMAQRAEAEGDIAAAVRCATRAVELTGDDERAFRYLLELFDRVDDTAGALGAYDAFARRLKTEYGAEPASETRYLAEGIRTRVARFQTAAPEPASAVSTLSAAPTASSAKVERGRGRGGKSMLYGASALAALFLTTILWAWTRPTPLKQLVRYTVVLNPAEALAEGPMWWGRLAVSPDGSRLAYIGGSPAQILLRPRSKLRAMPMLGTEGASKPFFSPNGDQLGFVAGKKLELVSVSGGTPILVTDSLIGAGGSWGPDGFIYADRDGSGGLVRVEARQGATPQAFTALDTASGEVGHGWPDVLPNGKGVILTVIFYRGNASKKRGLAHAIAVAEIPSGKHRVVLNDAVYARYAAPGYLLYVTLDGPLMAVPFDQNSMKLTGSPTALMDDSVAAELGVADLAVSPAGTLVYAPGGEQSKQELVWVTRDGKAQSVDPDWTGYFWNPALSPDGKQLAVSMLTSRRTADVWIKQLDRGPRVKLILQGRGNLSPTWTPDGRAVTFSSNAGGSYDLWTKRTDGSAQAVLQFHDKWGSFDARWSGDGKWLIYKTPPLGGSASSDILGIRPGIDTAPVPLVTSKFTELSPALSPDSRWLAYTSNETGGYEVYVVPFPNTSRAKWLVSKGGGARPLWSHRGNELFYHDGAGNLVAVQVKTNPTFSVGRTTILFPAAAYASAFASPMYAVAPDDRRFLMVRIIPATAPQKLIVVENWFEALKTRSRK